MSRFKPNVRDDLKKEFLLATKTILKEEISKNLSTLESNKIRIVNSFNKYIDYISPFYPTFETEAKKEVRDEIIALRSKLQNCYNKLGLDNNLPEDFFR